MALDRYRSVLREPHIARLLATSLFARLPQGMSSLAILLFLAPRLGYGRAGLATGVSVATGGLSNVVLARLVDRSGARAVLLLAAPAYSGSMVGLALTGHRSYGLALGWCALVGLASPPVTSVARGLWPRLLAADAAQTIYGLEATAQELVFILGPATVAFVAGVTSGAAAVVVTGAVALAGALSFAAAPPLAGRGRGASRRRQSLRGSGVLTYAALGLCLTAAFAMGEVATVAFVGGRNASAVSGGVLALWSIGSMIGGIRFGARGRAVTDRGLVVAVVRLGGSVAVAALAPGTIGLAVILLLGGVTISPALARLYTRIGAVAPPGASIEAFGWLSAGFLVGASLGSSLAGVAVEGLGARVTFALAGVAAASGTLVFAPRLLAASR